MRRKLRKLVRDPMAYCLDSRHRILRQQGERAFKRLSARHWALGRANAHRKITVIMTAHNTAPYVARAVTSVLGQTHKNIDLMVIDDASSDDTLAVLQDIAARDARVRVYHSPKNHGTYWSKNWCLAQADGDLVAFQDSDDWSDPSRLQMQLGALIDRPDSIACTCRWRREAEDGTAVEVDGAADRMAAISLMVWRERALARAGFFDSVRIAADTEYIRRLEKLFGPRHVLHLRNVLYTGLIRAGSLTTGAGSGLDWQGPAGKRQRSLSGARAAYHEAFRAWHTGTAQNDGRLRLPFPVADRPFPAPDGILEGCADRALDSVIEVTPRGVAESAAMGACA